MAMKKQTMTEGARHHGQPSGHKVVHEVEANKQSVGSNKKHGSSGAKFAEGNLTRNADQPHGGAEGLPEKAAHMPESHRIPAGGVGYGQFEKLASKGADSFRGTSKKGALRVSGHSGAHMLGCKRK